MDNVSMWYHIACHSSELCRKVSIPNIIREVNCGLNKIVARNSSTIVLPLTRVIGCRRNWENAETFWVL